MCKILVAEDSFALANLLSFVLKTAGFDVDIHRTGLSAYEALCRQPYGILLLDQQMPKMTGLEIMQAVRAEGPNVDTPAFLCTAKSHEISLEAKREELRISAIIHKPFSPKDLITQLKHAAQSLKV